MSLLELCTRAAVAAEGGSRARAAGVAGRVCAFVIEWAWMIRETGVEHPTVEQWGEWAHVPRRTAFHRQAEFRRLFGEWHDDPTPLARYVNEWAAKHRDQHPRRATVPDVLTAA
jgi:hypothetical protein